jgi:hypothetical protein
MSVVVGNIPVFSHSFRSALYWVDTTASCGSSGLGHDNSACNDNNAKVTHTHKQSEI